MATFIIVTRDINISPPIYYCKGQTTKPVAYIASIYNITKSVVVVSMLPQHVYIHLHYPSNWLQVIMCVFSKQSTPVWHYRMVPTKLQWPNVSRPVPVNRQPRHCRVATRYVANTNTTRSYQRHLCALLLSVSYDIYYEIFRKLFLVSKQFCNIKYHHLYYK